MNVNSTGYRPELDGLRAIAVIAVFIYHAELAWKGVPLFSGGFLGVDIFFVLSGYLITGILLDKQPSLLKFYKSRVDRIYPALLLMLLLTSVAAYKVLSSEDMLKYAESLKGALGFYSNYVFMHEEAYAADASKYKPLIHTWTLGVEWQFYLIFPLIMWGVRRFFIGQVEQIIIFLFSASLFFCIYLLGVDESHAFYSTPSRVWELFSGSLLFLISRRLSASWVDSYLSALGVVIIAYALVFFKDDSASLISVSLVAVVGSAMFILFTRPGTIVYKLITLRAVVFLGVLSYSLYLYHQPVLVLYRLGFSEVGIKQFFLIFALCVLLAYLSYRFFEEPMRRGQGKAKYLIMLVLVVLVFAFANGALNTKGYPKRQGEAISGALQHFEVNEWVRLSSENLGQRFNGKKIASCNWRTPSTACEFPGVSGNKALIVVGDSFSGVFTYSLKVDYPEIKLSTYHYSGCPLFSSAIVTDKNYPECWEINKQRWVALTKHPASNVLVGTNFGGFGKAYEVVEGFRQGAKNLKGKVPAKEVYASFRKSIERLIALGHHPIILLQPPKPTYDVKKEMQRKAISGVLEFNKEYSAVSTESLDKEVRKVLKGLDVSYIDLNKQICAQGSAGCLTFNEDGALYNSGQHLSYFGVKIFIGDVIKAMR